MDTYNLFIVVNGQTRPYMAQNLAQTIISNGYDPAQTGIAVAVNSLVAPRAEWHNIQLKPGDRVEIIKAVAGG